MELMALFDRLWPLPRSITGQGVRDTLSILNEIVPIKQLEYPTGLDCFDWTIPKEWNIKDAYVKNKKGEKLIDFQKSNLHVRNYSIPVHQWISKEELLEHLHTLPALPNAIPYITSYYQESWGFCMEHNRLAELTDEEYEVVIDATLQKGHLTIGEGFLPGESEQEILLSTYICHPSMANNELSGPIVQTFLYQYLLKRKKPLKYSYRFLFVPETIGSIVYLAHFGHMLKQRIVAGYVITCVGDPSPFTYKKSKRGNTLADRAALNVLQYSGHPHQVIEWSPGSDERQYCSPGFNLPVGSIMRSLYGSYEQYHTSLDNRDFISEAALRESIQLYVDVVETLETNDYYMNCNPFCEPQLGKRGLYPTVGAQHQWDEKFSKILYLLAFSDGHSDIIDIADRMKIVGRDMASEIDLLKKASLLEKRDHSLKPQN